MADKVTTTIYSNMRGVGRQSKANVLDTLNAGNEFIGHIDREQRGCCYDIAFKYVVSDNNGHRLVQYRLRLIDDAEPAVGFGMNFERAYSNMLNRVRKYEAHTRFLRNRERFLFQRRVWQEELDELA